MNESYADLRLGLFVHYVFFDASREYAWPPIGLRADGIKAATLDELADGLDVDNLAESAAAMRAQYVILTAWHSNMNILFPCAAMEKSRPGHCSRRDVIADLIAALDRRKIGLMLYVHPSDGHDFPKQDQDRLGWNDGPPYSRWSDFLHAVFDEMARRYRGRILGYWVDGGLPAQVDQGAGRLRETIRQADPGAVVVQNEAFDNNYFRRWADFGCREGVRDPYPCEAMASACVITRMWWAWHSPLMVTPEVAFQYTVLQAAVKDTEGGGAVWSAGPYPGGVWEAGVEDFFSRLGRYVDAVKPALFETRPSRSFITEPKTELVRAAPFCAATESFDAKTTYLHVLRPPAGRELVLPAPRDGKIFRDARLLVNRRSVALAQDGQAVRLTLGSSDGWQQLDTVIVLA